ncbi:MAG: hypothetical protein LBR07_05505, partial [Puniceicoccales bacterium]|nr:hypothetical protein [Puniceicoccales bacterium]
MRFLAPLFLGAFCFAINTLPAAFAQSSAQSSAPSAPAVAQPPALPPEWVVSREFSDADKAAFATPPRVNFPQTWFHFLGGNVSREGITADLSAIAGA